MVGHVVNIFVIMAVGIILADMVANANGTSALFNGMGGIWKTGVNGMLGKPTP
jgi:purine-cytosine permease-like protein